MQSGITYADPMPVTMVVDSGIVHTGPIPGTMVASLGRPDSFHHGGWTDPSICWGGPGAGVCGTVVSSLLSPSPTGMASLFMLCCVGFREGEADDVKLPFLPLPGHGISVLQPGAVIAHLGSLLL